MTNSVTTFPAFFNHNLFFASLPGGFAKTEPPGKTITTRSTDTPQRIGLLSHILRYLFFVIWPFSINRFSTFIYYLFSRSRSLSIIWLFTLPFVSSLPESSLVFYSLASSSSFFLFLFFFFFFFTVSTFWKEEAEQARRTRREKREERGGGSESVESRQKKTTTMKEKKKRKTERKEEKESLPACLPACLAEREREHLHKKGEEDSFLRSRVRVRRPTIRI